MDNVEKIKGFNKMLGIFSIWGIFSVAIIFAGFLFFKDKKFKNKAYLSGFFVFHSGRGHSCS